MKCYHCNENEAEYRFFVNYMGQMGEIHVCGDCVEKFRHYAEKMFEELKENGGPALEGWGAGPIGVAPMGFAPPRPAAARPIGKDPFPEDAGSLMKQRRQLNELRQRLQDAVDREDYESAAGIRDEIAKYQMATQ